ncbi:MULTISPECIES: RHS repeat domain-containing protein [unclassified Neisseria]|uniref:RHS repeat domain-containing protein n=1 Tax=unclassified Neisseria TaxID=2623750 RepID=UPI0026665209|nr:MULTISPECIES: RHS repeat-associated core domain-containing protein [unclassified Neisseria]MDO1510168.1 RHS repeat-associated core domain-containing protein [Neisseria sp. MVDL19-042950]MDO1516744.1 RHS repeat-associated core domain-containing protein [Neisseria sp. MVDL18-041461]MDO1563891.1 RHS repeat-associated core domain-containing protein [Neisseria sp. MVDL20-010259]
MEQTKHHPTPPKVMNNRVTHYNGINYYYNKLGNVICRETQGIIQNLHYDLFDQLVKIETFTKLEDGTWEKDTWGYEYDTLRCRTKKAKILDDNTQTNITEFLWDGSRLFQEIYANGRYTYTYADQNSYEPLAQVHNWTNTEGETNETIFYFHCDQAGSPREMTDKDGNLVWYGKYRAWGQLTFAESLVPNVHQPFRLQGQYYDPESGLHYNFHRYYDPNFGRFITQDPIGLAGGSNAYFAFPNAQTWADPLGLATLKINGRIIRVHANDVDPFPSMPHGHIYDENLVVDKDGRIYRAGKCHSVSDSVGSLSKKEIKVWQKWLKQQGFNLD